MLTGIILLHPGPIPHPEVGSGSSLILGLFLGVTLTAAGWVTLDAIAERRAGRNGPAPRLSPPAALADAPHEQLVVGRPVRVAAPSISPATNPVTPSDESPSLSVAASPATPWRPAGCPLRLMTLVLGFLMGLLVVDDVESTAALARFAGTETARIAARSIYAFTVLIFVGAALVVVAPRAAAIVFGLAGLLGAFLGASGIWSDWIGGFDAELILGLWTDRLIWAGAAFLLALLAMASVTRRRPGRGVVAWRRRPMSAPDRA